MGSVLTLGISVGIELNSRCPMGVGELENWCGKENHMYLTSGEKTHV